MKQTVYTCDLCEQEIDPTTSMYDKLRLSVKERPPGASGGEQSCEMQVIWIRYGQRETATLCWRCQASLEGQIGRIVRREWQHYHPQERDEKEP